MKKVLMISTFGPNVRGVSPYADSLASALEKTHSIELKKMDYLRAFPEFLLPGGTSYTADNTYAAISYLNPFSWNVNKNLHADLVHLQYWSPAFLPLLIVMLRLIKKSGTKTLVTWHNPVPHESIPLTGGLERKMMKLCDGIICHTERGKELIMHASPGTSVTVCHHGCEITGIRLPSHSDYQLCDLAPDKRYVLFFGNIRPYKGLDILLDAWRQMSPGFPNTRLIIAGRLWGDKKSMLSRIISNMVDTASHAQIIEKGLSEIGPSIVSDLTFVSDEKLNAYLRIACFAVFPYRSFESQSGAASRAAGAGVPIITTGVGGLRMLAIDDRFISDTLSSETLADLLVERLGEGGDYRDQQLKKAQEVSWESVAQEHLDCYSSL